jgi:hypothetical protein
MQASGAQIRIARPTFIVQLIFDPADLTPPVRLSVCTARIKQAWTLESKVSVIDYKPRAAVHTALTVNNQLEAAPHSNIVVSARTLGR